MAENLKAPIGIVGAGMMGASLAVLFTGNGYKTVLLARRPEKAKGIYETYFEDLEKLGLVTAEQRERCRALLSVTTQYEALADCEFVFECVYEQLDIKHDVYAKIEANCPSLRALASATSAISGDDLAEGMKNKALLAVAHPFNPPHLVPCVEVVKSSYTSEEALSFITKLLESVGREVVVLNKGAAGFIVNRIQFAMYREALYMVEKGCATPDEIDRALMFSIAPRYTSIGLFEHFDNAGLDTDKSVADYLMGELCSDPHTPKALAKCVEEGNLGVKTGKGMIDWSKRDLDDLRRRASAPFLKFFHWKLP